MARVTVEDCVLVVPNRFELCLIASNRAKNILSGSHTDLSSSGEKPAVIALREIADNTVDVEGIRENIVASIRNRGSSNFPDQSSEKGMVAEDILNEVIGQHEKEPTFVSENIEVED